MGKRFGRNQRRRAREAIASLQAELDTVHKAARSQLMHYNSSLEEKCRTILQHENTHRMIRETLGKHTVFTQPIFSPNVLIGGDCQTLRVALANPGSQNVAATAPRAPTQRRNADVLMHVLRTKACVDAASNAIHLRARLGDIDEYVYVLSDDAFDLLPPEQLMEILANEIAASLSRSIVTARLTRRVK